ncbi:MAG: hypothetical protein HeimC3_41760 [Candidatus Heimdallarchaeota archaeon LC_3]|nr:MAG: hypothetical protein HeimC3_41760 [Candidatus Heimdallarchaeota archaeon LC_3]
MKNLIPVHSDPAITNYIPYSKEKLKALGENTRISILEILSRKPHSVGELQEELQKLGLKKSTNTIRHHVDILKKTELISLVGLKEGQGAILKYYGSNSRLVNHDISTINLGSFNHLIQQIIPEMENWVTFLLTNYSSEIMILVNSLRPCEKCDPKHFIEYVIIQVFMNGLGKIMDQTSLEKFQKGFKE